MDHPRDFLLNNELQAYGPDAISVRDGVLRLEARAEPRWYRGVEQHYVSGTVTTHTRFSFRFGRFEVRAKVPAGKGLWPAAWLLPESLKWPPEIDLFEFRGQEPTQVLLTHHWLGSLGAFRFNSGEFVGPDFSRGFHVFSVEWTQEVLRWSIDGVVRHEASEHIPAVPMYLNVGLAVGGTLPGPPSEETRFPAVLEIDWIRVHGLP